MIVKVCGMREPENIRQVECAGADWMGFIFYPRSPRYAGDTPPAYLPCCHRIGVFVNESADTILPIASAWGLWGVQLHGAETPQTCQTLRDSGLKVIKAFGINGDCLPSGVADYAQCCDWYLFDTATSHHGGSGRKFDWKTLHSYNGELPFLLSGGIGINDVDELRRFSHPLCIGYDVNSSFEIRPGVKDAALVQKFISQIKNDNNHESHQQTL